MNEDAMNEIHAADLQMSKDMGVSLHLYINSSKVIDWFGRFTVTINDTAYKMIVTPSTLFLNEADITAPVAHLTGSEWIDSPMGELFHADFLTPMVNGTFQIFRRKDSLPFNGFEHILHTHILVYTDASGKKEFLPVTPDFSSLAPHSSTTPDTKTQPNRGAPTAIKIKQAWIGAIHMEAKIDYFHSVPQFQNLEQPVRCYLVGYKNDSFMFCWSKPGEFGTEGTFFTDAMKEDPSKNGERYFNDAHIDAFHFDSTLTLTNHKAFGGRAFIYKQQFDGWIGAFAGNLDFIDPRTVPSGWIAMLNEHAAELGRA